MPDLARLKDIFRAIPGWDPSKARLTPLRGGITNENFKVEINRQTYVLRLNGKGSPKLGINRDNEYACAVLAAQSGVGPQVVGFLDKNRALLTRFVDGKALTPKGAAKPNVLRRIVDSIRRFHLGSAFPGQFSPFQTARNYHSLAEKNSVRFPRNIPLSRTFTLMGLMEKALTPPTRLRPCHNDLLASNFIDDGKTVKIIDWEYAAMGDPFFDLGNFAVNQSLDEQGSLLLLREYFGAARPEDLARLHLYRLASDLREAFWGFLQSAISTIRFDFIGYGTKHLDRFLRNASSRRFELWLEAAEAGAGSAAADESSFPDWRQRLSRAKRESNEGHGIVLDDFLQNLSTNLARAKSVDKSMPKRGRIKNPPP